MKPREYATRIGRSSRWLWAALGFWILAAAPLAVVFSVGCGRKGSGAQPGSTTPRTAQSERDRDFAIPLSNQIRWTYEAMPTPEPSKKPAYLLRSFKFAELASTLDAEAQAVCRELAKILKERPQIRILTVGLTDAGREKVNAENLGMLRARAARDFLVSQGVAKERTEIASYGARQAEGVTNDPVSVQKDRRAEIWLLEE